MGKTILVWVAKSFAMALRAALFALLAACAAPGGGPEGLNGPSPGDLVRLTAPANPPAFVSAGADTAAAAADGAARAAGRLLPPGAAQRVQVAATPWLRASVAGAAFLASPAPRALARGEPPASCPAAAASPPAPTAAAAAEAALGACRASLARRAAASSCGCRVVAVDGALLAPLESFGHAPSVSAFLIAPAGARRLVAEALKPLDGLEIVSLRDMGGELARAALRDEAAELVFIDEPETVWRGAREPFGWRRGRLAERISFVAPDGRTLTLLLGIEMRDAYAG